MTAKMLVIGGVYLVKGEQHVLTLAILNDGDAVVKNLLSKEDVCVKVEDLEGPSHVPCPYCGRIQVLKSNFGQIEFPEHLERCRFVAENQPEVVTE